MSLSVSSIKVPGIKLGNASTEEIVIIFDSAEKIFPPGEVVELEGHIDFPRTKGGAIIPQGSPGLDAFGRPVPGVGAAVPKLGAGSVDIAQFCLERGTALGLYHVTGDVEADKAAFATAQALGRQTRTEQAEKTMGDWRQTCRAAASAGLLIPPMPLHVAKADKFLVENPRGAKEVVKRFQIKLDGASYDTIEEAKTHIFRRPHYTEYRDKWKDQVVDRFGDDVVVNQEPEPEVESLKEKPKKK